MKAIFFSILVLLFTMSQAQTKVYEGNSNSYSKVICNLKDGKIYKGNSSSYSAVLVNISGNKIYQGNSGSYSKVLRSEEHTSELQSRGHLVCRLLLEKKKKNNM